MYDDRDERDWIENLKNGRTWARGGFVLLFLLALWFVRVLVAVVAVVQFGATLITGRPFALALPFGRSLSAYVGEIVLYVTCNSDRRPWPLSPWPEPGEGPEDDDGGYGGDWEAETPVEPKTRKSRTPPATPADEPDRGPKPATPDRDEPAADGGDDSAEDGDDGRPRSKRGAESEGNGRASVDDRRTGAERHGDSPAGEPSAEPPRPDA